MLVLEYGRPNRKPSRRLIVTGILVCGFTGVLLFRAWRRAAAPAAPTAPLAEVAPPVGKVLPPWATPPTTSAIAGMFLILRTQATDQPVFNGPSVQPTTRKGIEPGIDEGSPAWPGITPRADRFATRQAGD